MLQLVCMTHKVWRQNDGYEGDEWGQNDIRRDLGSAAAQDGCEDLKHHPDEEHDVDIRHGETHQIQDRVLQRRSWTHTHTHRWRTALMSAGLKHPESLFKHSPVWCCVSDLWLWSVWWAAVCWREGRRPSSWAHTPNTSLAEWGRAAHRTTTADWRQRSAPTDPRRSRPDKHQHILINNLTHLYHIHIEIYTNQML